MFEKTDESILGDVRAAGVPRAERIMKLSGMAQAQSIQDALSIFNVRGWNLPLASGEARSSSKQCQASFTKQLTRGGSNSADGNVKVGKLFISP